MREAELNLGILADALLSATCLQRDLSWSLGEWCDMVPDGLSFECCESDSARFSHLCCSVLHCHFSSLPAALRARLPSHTYSPMKSDTAPHCSAESLKDKWPCALTMAVILWRGLGATSLYSANLITDLLFACVNTQCNLKATPGLLGDAKTACQSTGTPPEWIKVGYSGLSWPWGDVHGFCFRRNKLNTVFYYRDTVKCVMYVNPSGIARRRARIWRDKMMALRVKGRAGRR